MASRNSLGAFQFRRRASTAAPSELSIASNRPMRSTRARGQTHSLGGNVLANRLLTRKKPPLPLPVEEVPIQKTPPRATRPSKTQKRKKVCRPPHKRVETDLPEEVRMKHLVELILREERDSKMVDASAAECEEFDDAMLSVMDHLHNHAQAVVDTPQSIANRRRPNPANEELRRREIQLEAIVASYEQELKQWEGVEAAAPEIAASELSEVLPVTELTDVADADALAASAKETVELFILQSMHVTSLLKGLQSRNKETNLRVQAIADTLNNRVLSELGNSDGEMGPVPPDRFARVETGA